MGDALSLLYDSSIPPLPAVLADGMRCGTGVDDSADLIFLHPPYHNLIPYSGNMWGTPHKDDLSRCSSYPEFVEKLNYIVQKLFMALRRDGRLAILVGDIRTKGSFYSMQHDLMRVGQMEAFIVKGQYNCVSDTRSYKKPFIPVVTEYLLLFHKQDALFFPFAVRRETTVDLRKEDIPGLTWHHLIRLTMEELSGRAKLSDLGDRLAAHPKAKKNPHFRDRIRATACRAPGTIYFLRKRLLCPELCRGLNQKQEAEISMKITKEEKMYLERCGYGRKDFAQIQEATRRDKTTYEMDGAPITRDEAVTRLGRLDYLSGIARSAFHFTAMRITEDGKVILFDSSRLFGKE
ncbi:MAG: hypothetical protein ACLSAF_20935 [Intestinimonas sp.]